MHQKQVYDAYRNAWDFYKALLALNLFLLKLLLLLVQLCRVH
jgi:hypothetical protein